MLEKPTTLKWRRRHSTASGTLSLIDLLFLAFPYNSVTAIHHMKRAPMAWVVERDSSVPLVVTNRCDDVIYPGIVTQSGTAPDSGGFKLDSGETKNLTVGQDWQGRVWARTNCTFNSQGTGSCGTGDCGGIINCKGTGNVPVSLAEFTLATSSGQTFYDISLVDGYNIPIAIVSLYPESNNPSLQEIPPNLTNPICIGTAALLEAKGSTSDANIGTNSSFPIPLEQNQSPSDLTTWCPWDLLLSIPTGPNGGVYTYPDSSLQRPPFNPCYSACAKNNKPQDCCTGSYDSPSACKPSTYSSNVKKVCPDAYSYAFDDQTSTFIIPSGGGFEVVFCPVGRSSNILDVLGDQLRQVAATGHVEDTVVEGGKVLRQKEVVAKLETGQFPMQLGRVNARRGHGQTSEGTRAKPIKPRSTKTVLAVTFGILVVVAEMAVHIVVLGLFG